MDDLLEFRESDQNLHDYSSQERKYIQIAKQLNAKLDTQSLNTSESKHTPELKQIGARFKRSLDMRKNYTKVCLIRDPEHQLP